MIVNLINKYGLVATILNRSNSLGPSSNKLSRGNIVIDVLNKNNIEDAISYIKSINNSKWKPFNLFLLVLFIQYALLLLAKNKLNAGSCFVNDFVKSDPRLPFNNIKKSKYNWNYW